MTIAPALLLTDHKAGKRPARVAGTVAGCLFAFIASFVVLFLGMTRHPSFFDEGLVLTAAMRTAAGQLPHRDFYTLYGPAQFYLLAGLFHLFGQTLIVERLFDLFDKAMVVTAVWATADAYCRKTITVCVSFAALLWLFGMNGWPGSAMMAVSILNIAGATLILPSLLVRISSKRLFAAGAVAGIAVLFRHDTGVLLLAIQVCVLLIAAWFQPVGLPAKILSFLSNLWPCLIGFALFTLPPAIYYLSVAPLAPLMQDMILYPARYYHRGRNLPFPRIGLHSIEDLEIYVPIVIAAVALWISFDRYRSAPRGGTLQRTYAAALEKWQAFSMVFGLLTAIMYLKGLVRVSVGQTYLAIIPSLLLLGVLFEHRASLRPVMRSCLLGLTGLCFVAVVSLDRHIVKKLYLEHLSVPGYWIAKARKTVPPEEAIWCSERSSLTVGLCFLPEPERIQTINYINSHTTKNQTLYVGLRRHDIIFANDSIIYFGTERLPATKWSELDPDLESRADIQTEMVREFEKNAPPYVVLDKEFEGMTEPNDSAKSSGVTLLDDYIRSKYQPVKAYGYLFIWKRILTDHRPVE